MGLKEIFQGNYGNILGVLSRKNYVWKTHENKLREDLEVRNNLLQYFLNVQFHTQIKIMQWKMKILDF